MAYPTRRPTQVEIETFFKECVDDFNDSNRDEKASRKDCKISWQNESECIITIRPKGSSIRWEYFSLWQRFGSTEDHEFIIGTIDPYEF